MISSADMITLAAERYGIPCPSIEELHEHDIDHFKEEYPKFWLYCVCQIGRSIFWGEHWDNARVISELKDDEIMTITPEQLEERGFSFGPGANRTR
jgi:hypothetical protein